MLATAPEPTGEFRVGEILTRAWSILWANFVLFVVVAAIASLPGLYLLQNQPPSSDVGWTDLQFGEGQTIEMPLSTMYWNAIPWRDLWVVPVYLFVSFFLNTIGLAIVFVRAFRRLGDRSVQIGMILRQVGSRGGPLLGLATLYSLAVTIGYFPLFIPGLVLTALWSACVAACVIEGRDPIDSLARSASLTRSYRLKILGIALFTLAANIATGWIVALLVEPAGSWISNIGDLTNQALWTAYSNCLAVIIYHELRVAKEGTDAKQIAAVFD
jgi:hypothetical protein